MFWMSLGNEGEFAECLWISKGIDSLLREVGRAEKHIPKSAQLESLSLVLWGPWQTIPAAI